MMEGDKKHTNDLFNFSKTIILISQRRNLFYGQVNPCFTWIDKVGPIKQELGCAFPTL